MTKRRRRQNLIPSYTMYLNFLIGFNVINENVQERLSQVYRCIGCTSTEETGGVYSQWKSDTAFPSPRVESVIQLYSLLPPPSKKR